MSAAHTREAVGHLCRWCLLAGAGLAVAGIAWLSLRAAVRVAADVGADVAMADWLTRPAGAPDERVWVWGYLSGPPPAIGKVALAAVEGRPPRWIRALGDRCGTYLPTPRAGTVRATILGLPYGARAFHRSECTLMCVGPGRRLLLIDARLADPPRPDSATAWRRRLGPDHATDHIALLHPGPREAYVAYVRRARAAGVACPVLYDARRAELDYTLRRAVRAARAQADNRSPELVTADPELARAAQGRGLVVHRAVCPGGSRVWRTGAAGASPASLPASTGAAPVDAKDSLSHRPIPP